MTRMTHQTHTTLFMAGALLTFGCDSNQLDTLAQSERFQTSAVVEEAATPFEGEASPEVLDRTDVESIEDLAHTAVSHLDAPESAPENTSFGVAQADEKQPEEGALGEELTAEESVADGTLNDEAPIDDIFEYSSEPILWTPSGTYKLPAYGAGCRFVTDDVIQIPSNGLIDDSLAFDAEPGPEASLAISVETPHGHSLSASVDMKRGLVGRSYRQASGEAMWSDKDGDHVGAVVDGTICFDEKLANGLDDVLAEFSLIVEMDGVHYAMGGNVLIGGAHVAAMNGFTVDGVQAVDIDLR